MTNRIGIFVVLLCTICCVPDKVNSQDLHFSQYYAAPLYLNPCFSGATGGSRLIANYRHQWAGIPGAFVSYAFSFDHNLSRLNSGIGLYVNYDKAGSGGLSTTNIGVQYNYNITLNRKWAARLGADVAYRMRKIDFSKLVFSDQISKDGIAAASTEAPPDGNTAFMDFGAGGLLFSEVYWFGTSFHHLTQADQALIPGNETKLPLKYSLHAGAKFPLKNNAGKKTEKFVSPTFNFKGQHKFHQLDVGLYFYSNPVTIGVWYRGIPLAKAYQGGYPNNDAIVVLLGYKLKGLSIGYSYDITISWLSVITSYGSHEVSLIYEFNNKNNNKQSGSQKQVVIPCPKF